MIHDLKFFDTANFLKYIVKYIKVVFIPYFYFIVHRKKKQLIRSWLKKERKCFMGTITFLCLSQTKKIGIINAFENNFEQNFGKRKFRTLCVSLRIIAIYLIVAEKM